MTGQRIVVRMAKASPEEALVATDVALIVENLHKGEHPGRGGDAPHYFDDEDPAHLRALYDRLIELTKDHPGGLFRVAGLAHVVLANDILDPDDDCVALHPKFVSTTALAAVGEKIQKAITTVDLIERYRIQEGNVYHQGLMEVREALTEAAMPELLARPTSVLAEIERELQRAVSKFPTWPTDPLHACGVVQEESGELAKAVLQSVYEPHKSTIADVRSEAIQTAAMAIRFVRSLDAGAYSWTPGEQHSQDAEPQAVAEPEAH